jgi:hypothetical protein
MGKIAFCLGLELSSIVLASKPIELTLFGVTELVSVRISVATNLRLETAIMARLSRW